ncbi:MAG: hypothetical protein HKN21_17930 [Candidatus Eisenbacteria bacterium]|uniref:WYL domain-containing protein n=1 Tax=Eiseniibacteriota bacterium TaxID=2212470 RepID=A0A7Y2H4B6_UNCEI|nr:hypothetical protein [Candidatus Eisenbacteria bacterium]
MLDAEIVGAISNWQLMRFEYQGKLRVVEPHVYGHNRGADQILTYQVDGESGSGELPGWRRFFVEKIEELEILPERFEGPRPDMEDEMAFGQTFMVIEDVPRVRRGLLEVV